MPVTTWLLGRDVQLISVTPLTVHVTTGVISEGSVATLTDGSVISVADELEIRVQPVTENIQSVGRTHANNVITELSTSVTVTEILSKNRGTLLAAMVAGGTQYYKVVAQRNSLTWTYYGVLESYEEVLRRGKLVGRLSLAMVDTNATNPSYA